MITIESAYIFLGKSYSFVTSVLADRLICNPGKPEPNTAQRYSTSSTSRPRPMRIVVPSPGTDCAVMVCFKRSQICLHRYSPSPVAFLSLRPL